MISTYIIGRILRCYKNVSVHFDEADPSIRPVDIKRAVLVMNAPLAASKLTGVPPVLVLLLKET
jgi:hypothetical protein